MPVEISKIENSTIEDDKFNYSVNFNTS